MLVKSGEVIPADLICVITSSATFAYISTEMLDGESDFKFRVAQTEFFDDVQTMNDLKIMSNK